MTEDEWELMKENLNEDDVAQAEKEANAELAKINKEYKMDDYDKEDDNGLQFFHTLEAQSQLKPDKNLADPEADEDADNYVVQDSDMLLVAGNVEEDCTSLEIYNYIEDECHIFMHHDILLDSYPLALEWIPSVAGNSGNFMAIGSFNPTIDIWNMDILDVSVPCSVLGVTKKNKRGKKGMTHTEAVMALNRNRGQTHVLASGSADCTVKLWDLNEEKGLESFSHHTDKVQCVKWHPAEHAIMMTAAFDRKLAVLDVRQGAKSAIMTQLTADAECAIWSVQNPMQCFVSSEDGHVKCVDIRNVSKGKTDTVWDLQAHQTACSGVTEGGVPGMMVTAGLDGYAKVWNITDTPKLVYERDLQAGPIFSCNFSEDAPPVCSFSGNQVVVWDLRDTDVVKSCFNL